MLGLYSGVLSVEGSFLACQIFILGIVRSLLSPCFVFRRTKMYLVAGWIGEWVGVLHRVGTRDGCGRT